MDTAAATLPPSSLLSKKKRVSSIRFIGLLKIPDADTDTATLPPSSLLSKKKRVSSIRFIGLLKIPDADTDTAPELDEIWASDDSNPSMGPTYYESGPEPGPVYTASGCGLSALLAEDRIPAVRRPARVGPGTGPDLMGRSAPVNVPTWRHARGDAGLDWADDDVEEEEEWVPPHVIVARSHVTTFSVFEGVGRTLKGRDLRRVRNAVFQKTGFLD